jgi:hypothetical protein
MCVVCFDAPKDHIIVPSRSPVRVRGVCLNLAEDLSQQNGRALCCAIWSLLERVVSTHRLGGFRRIPACQLVLSGDHRLPLRGFAHAASEAWAGTARLGATRGHTRPQCHSREKKNTHSDTPHLRIAHTLAHLG